MARRREEAENGTAKIALAAQPFIERKAAIRDLSQSAAVIDNFYRNHGKNPNEFMDDLRVGGSSNAAWIRNLQQLYGGQGSPEAKELQAFRNAQGRLYQKLAGATLAYKSATIGGSQSDQEIASVKQYIADHPSWENLRGFLSTEGIKLQAAMTNAVDHGDSEESKLIWLAGHPPTLPNLDHPGAPTRGKK